ncbi:MAG: hypothetical protein FJX95_03410 [Bacteroidetes bacterium]|nr:hypothetical protein [Bacteroidota bacterium]
MKKILLICVSIAVNTLIAFAQPAENTNDRFTITLKNGTEYTGKIISDDGREMLIQTETIGKLYVLKTDLKGVKKIDVKKVEEFESNFLTGGRYLDEGPFTTRYNITTNALPIKKGENYAMTNFHGPEVHFAVSNRLNLGIMTTWIASPMALAAKYSIPTKNTKLNFSLGTLLMTSGYWSNFRGYGHLSFGNVTFGDRLNNLTLSAGYFSFNGPSNNPLRGPLGSVAGSFKVGPKANFIFDSMFGFIDFKYQMLRGVDVSEFDGRAFMVSPGMRFQSSESFAWQLSMAAVAVDEVAFPAPFLTLFKKF